MSAETRTDVVRLRVRRGTDAADRQPWTVDVPREPGMTMLDALLWARANVDPNLAFDFSCVANNSCKLCIARMDEKVGYLCTTAVTADEHELGPADETRIVRDLLIRHRAIW